MKMIKCALNVLNGRAEKSEMQTLDSITEIPRSERYKSWNGAKVWKSYRSYQERSNLLFEPDPYSNECFALVFTIYLQKSASV